MRGFLKRCIIRYLEFAGRHQLFVCIVAALSVIVAAVASYSLDIRTNLTELLPRDSQSVAELNNYLHRMGGVGKLIVVVEGPDVKANQRFIDDLGQLLAHDSSGLIKYVDYNSKSVRRFYERNFLYYLDVHDLNLVYQRIKQRIEYEKLKDSPLFVSLVDDEDEILSLEFKDIRHKYEKKLSASFSTVGDYYGGDEGHTLLMMIHAKAKELTSLKAKQLVELVDAKIDQLNPTTYNEHIRVGMCGSVKMMIEEFNTIRHDAVSTLLLCIALVALVVVLYFLRLRVIFLLSITLLVSIAYTFAVARMLIGYLNAQTASLSALIVGTGINYGIIQMARYLELRKTQQKKPIEAMEDAVTSTLKPTFLAAITTAVAFAVLSIAHVQGFSQFGLIGAAGVVFCWLVTVFILPVMTLLTERIKPLVKSEYTYKRRSAVIDALAHVAISSPAKIIVIASLLGVGALQLVVHYAPHAIEYDFLKLRNKATISSGAKALERRIYPYINRSLTPAVVLVDRPQDGLKVCETIRGLSSRGKRKVGDCYSIYDLLPKDQADKEQIVEKLRQLLDSSTISMLDARMRSQLKHVEDYDAAYSVEIEDLPAELIRPFTALDGSVGAAVYIDPPPGMSLTDGRDLIRFAGEIRNIRIEDGRIFHAAGEPLVYSDLMASIGDEAPVLTLASLFAVVVIVLLILKSLRVSAVIIAALMWAVVAMMGSAALFGVKINFFNFIVLPLTFGIGVDYAINVAHRLRREPPSAFPRGLRHTGGAVVLCSLTTIIGYSVLAFANNQLIATFGQAALFGEIACLVAAVLIVPAMIVLAKRVSRTS